MYKVWEINDIRFIINEISKIWNYPCGINIEISKRVTKRMGAFFYKNAGNNIIPIKFVFSYTINGSYPEEVVKEVIIHEYLHYYCNSITKRNNGHNKFFKECCLKSGISPNATFKYNSEKQQKDSVDKGVLYSAGMIAGEGLVGILLAIFAVFGINVSIGESVNFGNIGGVVLMVIMILCLLKFSLWKKSKEK